MQTNPVDKILRPNLAAKFYWRRYEQVIFLKNIRSLKVSLETPYFFWSLKLSKFDELNSKK